MKEIDLEDMLRWSYIAITLGDNNGGIHVETVIDVEHDTLFEKWKSIFEAGSISLSS